MKTLHKNQPIYKHTVTDEKQNLKDDFIQSLTETLVMLSLRNSH